MVPSIFRHGKTPDAVPGTLPARCEAMQRLLIILGVLLLVAGLAWPWLSRLGLGRLPGDIRIETEGGGFYFPIVTCLVISVVLTLLLWFFRR
jgi:hypothetical protein